VGKFTFVATGIADLWVIEPTVFGDERGYFMETYHQAEFQKAGLDQVFVQDNQSRSKKGVLRGLHYQKQYPQGKLVRVIAGTVFDVAVDLRPGSATVQSWFGLILSAENKKQFYIPPGFAHGFLVLSEWAEFTYKCTDFYHPDDEAGLLWNDPAIGIEWPLESVGEVLLSEKDRLWPGLNNSMSRGLKITCAK
jgi:dTDP-4-dehydrorhamnose 3,5-epimerase